ncbi:MAG: ABC transporter ATP-binding protein [Desulfurococcaceae archaeon]
MLLELRNVRKSYGPIEAVRGATMEVDEGEVAVIVGRSGAGKTTLLKIAGLLLRPDSGSVVIGGRDAWREGEGWRSRARREIIGYVPQHQDLLLELSARDNVELPLALAGLPRGEREGRVAEAARLLGISHLLDRPAGSLSGGERQRVLIARALAKRPQVLLADEPLSYLDDVTAEDVTGVLLELSRTQGVAIVMTTTELDPPVEAAKAFYMESGRLVPFESRLRAKRFNPMRPT